LGYPDPIAGAAPTRPTHRVEVQYDMIARQHWRPILALAVLALVSTSASAERTGAPRWRHPDKVLHALAGASGAMIGGAVAAAVMDSDSPRSAVTVAAAGLGSAAFLGLTKELLDLAGLGDPELLDLAATIFGGLVVSAGMYALVADQVPRRLEPARLSPPLLALGFVLALPVADAWRTSRQPAGGGP
jgi:hypothetical protein